MKTLVRGIAAGLLALAVAVTFAPFAEYRDWRFAPAQFGVLIRAQGLTTVALGDVVHIEDLNLFDAMGNPQNADSTVPCGVYEDANDTPIITFNMTQRTALTGEYRGTFTCSTANGCEIGKYYNVKCRPTVDGLTQPVNKGHFRIVPTEGNIYQRAVAVPVFKFQMFTTSGTPCLGKAGVITKRQTLGTAAMTNIIGAVVETGESWYYVPLTAAEMDADEIGFNFSTTNSSCRMTSRTVHTQTN